MCPSVEIDDEVWEKLKAQAEPFVDTPNTVLRRVLGLPGRGLPEIQRGAGHRRSSPRDETSDERRERGRRSRAPVGSLLPESEYELPILRVLAERGGSAPARDVINVVGKLLADRLTELDREVLPNGGERWQSRVQFTRLRLRERGLIKSGSPRGLWELADAGSEELAKQDGKN